MENEFVNKKSQSSVTAYDSEWPAHGLAILARLIVRALMAKRVHRNKRQTGDNNVAFQAEKQEARLSNNTKRGS